MIGDAIPHLHAWQGSEIPLHVRVDTCCRLHAHQQRQEAYPPRQGLVAAGKRQLVESPLGGGGYAAHPCAGATDFRLLMWFGGLGLRVPGAGVAVLGLE